MYSSTSGITRNINELQSDILAEKLSGNPYLKYHVLVEKNNKLGTTSQTIIGAINELLRRNQSICDTNKVALVELYNVLGHVGVHPELVSRVLSQAPSLIELVLDILDRVNTADGTRILTQKDSFSVKETAQSLFALSHKPIEGSVTININGITYYDGFRVDYGKLLLWWLFDDDHGGFDIKDSEVNIEYTYDSATGLEVSDDG